MIHPPHSDLLHLLLSFISSPLTCLFFPFCLLSSSQSDALTKEVATSEMTLQTTSTEVKDTKSQLQALEIELQSQLSMVKPQSPTIIHTSDDR